MLPPPQLNVAPAVVEVAVKVTVVTYAHVKVAGGLTPAFGGVMF